MTSQTIRRFSARALLLPGFAAVAVAMVIVAPSARADFDGSVNVTGYGVTNGVINEGTGTTQAILNLNVTPANESGGAGTTTRTFTNPNNTTFSSGGSNQGSTVGGGGTGGNTQSIGSGLFSYNQNGVYSITFNQSYSGHYQENSSYSLGNPSGDGSNGLSGSTLVTVVNVAPTIQTANQNGSNGNISGVLEGSTVTLNMTATDPGADSISFNINGGGAGVGGSGAGSTRTSSNVGVTYNNNGVFFNTFQATDQDGANSSNGPVVRSVTVINVAPTVTSLNLSSNVINEGDSITANMTATDPGSDTITFTIGGNPAGVDASGIPGSTRTSSTIGLGPYSQNGGVPQTYNIIGNAFDGDDNSATTQVLTVLNVAPVITLITANIAPGVGGAIVDFTATAFDPGFTDILTYAWDLDNDGFYDDYAGNPTPGTFYALGHHIVNVQVSDGDGGFGFGTFEFDVVPEPTTWLVMALSGGMLTLVTRFKRRRK